MKEATISARVSQRVRRLVEVAAEECGKTVSAFTADAAEEQARRRLTLAAVSEHVDTSDVAKAPVDGSISGDG